MDILEILKFASQKIIELKEACNLILVYVDDKHTKKVETILTLLIADKVSLNSALSMIERLKETTSLSLNTSAPSIFPQKRKDRRAARPLELDEYLKIVNLCKSGFAYTDAFGAPHLFRPNKQLAMTFILQANLGLRISDVLKLKPSTFKNDRLEVIEKKTGKLQYRVINKNLKELIYEYALDNNIKNDEFLIKVKVRAIQKQLEIIVNYLNLTNISSHSFRKLFGVTVYNETNGNIELLKELFNHSSIATTQRYIKVSQKEIDKVSSSIDFTQAWS